LINDLSHHIIGEGEAEGEVIRSGSPVYNNSQGDKAANMTENQQIIDKDGLSEKEEELSKTFAHSMKTFTALWEQEVKKGSFPPSDSMLGLDNDIRIAQVVSQCSESSSQE
jgi:hypothetical protein